MTFSNHGLSRQDSLRSRRIHALPSFQISPPETVLPLAPGEPRLLEVACCYRQIPIIYKQQPLSTLFLDFQHYLGDRDFRQSRQVDLALSVRRAPPAAISDHTTQGDRAQGPFGLNPANDTQGFSGATVWRILLIKVALPVNPFLMKGSRP